MRKGYYKNSDGSHPALGENKAVSIPSGSKAKILVVDNYDSFVFNLVQYLGQIGATCTVLRNDEVNVEDAKIMTAY